MSTPVLVTVELCFCAAGAEGIYCEVHKTKSIVPTKSSAWPGLALLYVGFESVISESLAREQFESWRQKSDVQTCSC